MDISCLSRVSVLGKSRGNSTTNTEHLRVSFSLHNKQHTVTQRMTFVIKRPEDRHSCTFYIIASWGKAPNDNFPTWLRPLRCASITASAMLATRKRVWTKVVPFTTQRLFHDSNKKV